MKSKCEDILKSPIFSGINWGVVEAYSIGQIYSVFPLNVRQNGSFENYYSKETKKHCVYGLILIGKTYGDKKDKYYLQIILSTEQFLAKQDLEFNEVIELLNKIFSIEKTSKKGVCLKDLTDLNFDFEWVNNENEDDELEQYKQQYL